MSDQLFDERDLRRALRLDGDEMPPRFDPAALAAAARVTALSRRAVAAMVVAVVATGIVGTFVWQELLDLAPLGVSALLGAAIGVVAMVATVLLSLAQAASEPVVPASLLAVLAVVIVYELVERREHRHVNAS